MSKQAAGKRIRLPAPQALRRCTRLLIGVTGFDSLAGYSSAAGVTGLARPASNRDGRGSTPRRRALSCSVGGTVNSRAPQAGDPGVSTGTELAARPYGLWVRIGALQAPGLGSSPSGVTARSFNR